MKLRFKPEDFKVREISSLVLADSGPFGVYLLAKSGWTTPDALARAARELRLPYGAFRYGGLKDRWAVTEQTVTVCSERDCSGDWGGFSLRPLGRAPVPMTPAAIVANSFVVTVRDLGDGAAGAGAEAARRLACRGFPNYFDDQRFGSVRHGPVFAGDLLVRRKWPGALRALMALPGPDDPPAVSRHRQALDERWGDWAACLAAADTDERAVFDLLLRKPTAAKAAVNLLPRETLAFSLAAWQSHLWNEVLRHMIRRRAAAESCGVDDGDGLRIWPGAVGPYLFPGLEETPGGGVSPQIGLPALGRKMVWPDDSTEAMYRALLAPLGLRPEDFVLRGLPKVQLRSFMRQAMVVPRELEISGPDVDEYHDGRYKLRLGFSLPAGSYATMLVKAVFARPIGGLDAHGQY